MRGSVVVEDRRSQFRVVRPRAVVEVVAAHHRPDVVDDAQLGVHVDRPALVVLDIEDLHTVTARLAHHRHGLGLSQFRCSGRHLLVDPAGHDRDQVQPR